MHRKICVVVVTYNPSRRVIANLHALARQCGHIVVVDNDSDSVNKSYMSEFLNNPQYNFIWNDHNRGIAAGMNQGVLWAIQHDYQWVATFDQDSKISDDYFKKLLDTYHSAKKSLNVGILAPLSVDEKSGRVLNPSGREVLGIRPVLTTITSGNLVPAQVYKKIGFYDEELFIDYIDHDFCMRLLKAGYVVMECPNVVLFHSLGDPSWHRFGGLAFMTTNHSPIRRYYNTRNRMIVYSRYFWIAPSWVMGDLWMFGKEFLKMMLVERDRRKKTRSIAKGIRDALLFKGH